MGDVTFAHELSVLCSRELPFARRDDERGAEMIERLAHDLGMAIAVIAGGRREAIDTLLAGAENYIAQSSAQHAALGRLLGTGARS